MTVSVRKVPVKYCFLRSKACRAREKLVGEAAEFSSVAA